MLGMIKDVISIIRKFDRKVDLCLRRFWCHRLGHLGRLYGHCVYCFEGVGDEVLEDIRNKRKHMREDIERLRTENEKFREGGG